MKVSEQYLRAMKKAAAKAREELLNEILAELVEGALLGDHEKLRDRKPLLERLK